MSIVVTGATGKLGRLVVEDLLDRGVTPADIVALARDPKRLSDFAARGVEVRQADYNDPTSLKSALVGGTRVLLVSVSEPGQRVRQHTNVIEAAKDAGVQLVAYTSIVHADTSSLVLASEHKGTEEVLAASGLDYAFLRNSWYIENYTEQLTVYLAHGLAGAAGDGKVSAAARRDYAAAAGAVLTQGLTGVFELGGTPFTLTELASTLTAVTGTTIDYVGLSVADYQQMLVSADLPAPVAEFLADADRGIAEGELFVSDATLVELIGRPSTPVAEVAAEAFAVTQ